jgi:CSLREA domain-containing protein
MNQKVSRHPWALTVCLFTLVSSCGRDTPPAHLGPDIVGFAATPSSVEVGEPVTFSWTIGHPEGLILTCHLDVTGDGTDAYTLDPCTSESVQTHTYPSAGTFAAHLYVEDAEGGFAEATFDVTVTEPEEAGPFIDDFAASPNPAQTGETITFEWTIGHPVGGDLLCRIDVTGDGTFDYVVDPCTSGSAQPHTYGASGTFVTRLRVEDTGGRHAEETVEIGIVEPPPLVAFIDDFAATPATAEVGEPVTFHWTVGHEGGEAVACRVDVTGDGADDYVVDPCASSDTVTHVYATPSTHLARLRVDVPAGFDGDTPEATFEVTVVPASGPYILAFTADPVAVDIGETTTFGWTIGHPNGDPLLCRLDANGDGTFDHLVDPCTSDDVQAHAYDVHGTYDARLRIEDTDGSFAERELTVTVNPPRVHFIDLWDFDRPARTGFPFTMSWDLDEPDGETLTCFLDMSGDGAWDHVITPCTSESTQAHTYPEAGTYDAVLRVEDSTGAYDVDTHQILVEDNVPPEISPHIEGNYRLRIGEEGYVSITTFSFNPVLCHVDSNGDGAFDRLFDPCGSVEWMPVIFDALGEYTLSFQAEDIYGDTSEVKTVQFEVGENRPPELLNFDVDPNPVRTGATATFSWYTADPDGDPLRCELDVDGNGTFDYVLENCWGTRTQPHVYATADTYTAVVRVTDSYEDWTETTLTVTVYENQPPQIDGFVFDPEPVRAGFEGVFSWTVSDPESDAMTCAIDVNDDGTFEYTLPDCTSGLTQAHTYAAAGTHTARLRVTDAHGAWSETTVSVTVNANQPPVIASFTADPTTARVGEYVTFTWTVTDPEGDDFTCFIETPNGEFEYEGCVIAEPYRDAFYTTGTHQITLRAVDTFGASSEETLDVTVVENNPPQVDAFEASVDTAAVGEPVTFTWAVSDPDGDPLRCELNLGDGSTLRVHEPCGTGGTYAFARMSMTTVTLTVRDGYGGVDTATLQVDVNAHVIEVDSTEDAVDATPGDGICADAQGRCTLRAAIMEANALAAITGHYGVYEIRLDAATYVLSLEGTDEDFAADGDLDVRTRMLIEGAGRDDTVIDGNGTVTGERVFHLPVEDAELTLRSLSVTGGRAVFDGGGINAADGRLVLEEVDLHGNSAGRDGGAIHTLTTLELHDVRLIGNSAGRDGGALHNLVLGAHVEDSLFQDNIAGGGGGAAYTEYGVLVSTSFLGNEAGTTGGAIHNAGTLYVAGGQQIGNEAGTDGGAVHAANTAVTTMLQQVRFQSNIAGGRGGAVRAAGTTTILASYFDFNTATSRGGAVYALSGTLQIDQSTLDFNTSYEHGGAVAIEAGVTSARIARSLLVNNWTTGTGGAIRSASPDAHVVNTTVFANTADIRGGGIEATGTVKVSFSTISANTASGSGAGGGLSAAGPSGAMSVRGIIVSGNQGHVSSHGCFGAVTSEGYNLFEADEGENLIDTGCTPAATDVLGAARLQALADNGGPTLTRALASDSHASLVIPEAQCTDVDGATVTQDQRSVTRPQLDYCDIGAFESVWL